MAGIERRVIFLYQLLDRIKDRGVRHHKRCGCVWKAGVLTEPDGGSIPDGARCLRTVHRRWDPIHRFRAVNGTTIEVS